MFSKSQHIRIFLSIIFLTLTIQTKADSWRDPSWKEMLDSSDLVALVQYSSSGTERASAKIITTYKGLLKSGDQVWISGFSNRYGPIDNMKKGDTYIVFANLNAPDAKRTEYWTNELKTRPELKNYVEAFKQNKAFYVWTPTSGDLRVKGKTVQYDLIQSSFYNDQDFYSIEDFEDFLFTYYNQCEKKAFIDCILQKLKPANESELSTQYLMKLFLLGFNQYDSVFKNYVTVNNTSSKYALAQLLGNIHSVESRNILIDLLNDQHTLVQGEAVRQLKNEPAEIVAPILLAHLKKASEANLGSSNIMDPVMNTMKGGKLEIIETLGALKYKPAVSDLLLELNTNDEVVFKTAIEALKQIGSTEYIPYINKHLDSKTDELIYTISNMIADDSLVQSLSSFKNFIATCDRNKHPGYEYTISTCCGIGHFSDAATISFMLSDFARFFTYKDSLESSKQEKWYRNYIESFTHLKVKEARPLILKSIFDWHGVNEDFGKNPKLFEIKKQLEDSVIFSFKNKFEKKGFQINYCIAFIENTDKVVTGSKPRAKFLIEVTVPSDNREVEYQQLICSELTLPKDCVYLRLSEYVYYSSSQDRFDDNNTSILLRLYLEYVKTIPNKADIVFLQALHDNSYIKDDYFNKSIKEAILEIKTNLNN